MLIGLLPLALWSTTTEPALTLQWHNIAELPPAPGQYLQPGLAGAFSGIHGDAMIIAGGANFPSGPNWEGGKKEYHRDVYVLTKAADGAMQWQENVGFQLEKPLAYGLSIGGPDGLICIGGMNAEGHYEDVFKLSWNPASNQLVHKPMPALPKAMANIAGARSGNVIYVAGTEEGNGKKYFWSLDLNAVSTGWKTLPAWPGSPRTHAVGVIQNNGTGDFFYLMKGRYKIDKATTTFHSDIQAYHLQKGEWQTIIANPADTLANQSLSAGSGIAIGANHILMIGGDNGTLFVQLEELNAKIRSTTDSIERQGYILQRREILQNHPGFSDEVLAFHTITQSWTKIGDIPSKSPVTTNAFDWDGQIIIPGGEIAPCVRTPQIVSLSVKTKTRFGKLNTFILIAYLALLISFGLYFSRQQETTDDFFKGGRRIPAWAAGISISGTTLSAITFMAVPAKTFATNWLYFFLSMTAIMVGPFIIRIFLPFYRRFNLTTAYEYLELRFNLTTRLIGSVMYILLQLGRMGIVLLLPSLALSVVTGINVQVCILSMGLLSIFYTVLGGIEAVIWTDVMQFFVLMGGAILSLIILYTGLDHFEMATHIREFHKMEIFDFSFDFTDATLWVVLLGGFAGNIITYGSDQTVIQRYLTTKDEKSAARSISIGVWMVLPTTLTFFTIGTLLFAFYKSHPEMLSPVLDKTDSIYPWYIINSLPNGISGLLIAAIFAASMSSLDSVMNSVSTVITTDYIRRLRPLSSERLYLRMARYLTILIGILGTAMAMTMALYGLSSLWDQFQLIVGLFAGGLGGIFLLGILSRKANGSGAVIGLLASGVLQYYMKEFTPIHFLLYTCTGLIGGFAFGFIGSFFFSQPTSEARQYTIYGLKK